MEANTLKEQLFQELDRLSEDRLREVLDFVEFLLQREGPAVEKEALGQEPDPIRQLIGAVEEEPFAGEMDDELYGT